MKLEINITESGSQIQRPSSQKPPLGAIFPAFQDSTVAVDTTLLSIAENVDSALPSGFQVFVGANIYGWTGSGWEDGNTASPVSDAVISGSATFRNPAAYDVGITW